MDKSRILIVEDEAIVAADIESRLSGFGYTVIGTAGSAEAAIRQIERDQPDLVLMDIMLGSDMDGIAIADRIRKKNDVPVVFLTAHADDATLQRAKISQPYGYIIKPIEEHTLHSTIQMALYRHRAEKRLRRLERWFCSTLRSIGDGVIAVDVTGRVIFMNTVAETLTGWPLREAVGLSVGEVFRLVDEAGDSPVENPALESMREGIMVQMTPGTFLLARDGTQFSVEDSASPIRNDEGKVTGAVVVFRDATEHRKKEASLGEMQMALESAMDAANLQQKVIKRDREFMAHAISHDLRSPLATLRLCADALAQNYTATLGEDGVELMDGIGASLSRMDQMIRSYLEFGKDGAKDPTSNKVLNMNFTVEQVINDIQSTMNHRKMEFTVTTLPPVRGSQGLIFQVWANLLSNALKYSKMRPVSQVRITGRKEGNENIYEVTDNGQGFDPEKAGMLFQDYQRLDADSGIEGVGLGLSVVRQIVERHGGRVWATAQPGQGATFGFSLPASKTP